MNKSITLDFYKSNSKTEEIEEWLEAPVNEKNYYKSLTMNVGIFDREQITKLLILEELIPFELSTMIHTFLLDLVEEDPAAMNWFRKHIARSLKFSIEQAKSDEKRKKEIIKEIRTIEKETGMNAEVPFSYDPLERMSLVEVAAIKDKMKKELLL